MIARVRELTRTITELYEQLADLVKQVAQQLLAEKSLGVLIAAKLIAGIAGIDRFTSDARNSHGSPAARRSRSHPDEPTATAWTQAATQPRVPHACVREDLARCGVVWRAKPRSGGRRGLRDPNSDPISVCLT
ncbi:MAG TPA: hypothetical protein VGH56_07080 [Solirubrobacteraceae bacterium]